VRIAAATSLAGGLSFRRLVFDQLELAALNVDVEEIDSPAIPDYGP
jgi:hypothetical protein